MRALVFRFGWDARTAETLTVTAADHWAEEAATFMERNRSSDA